MSFRMLCTAWLEDGRLQSPITQDSRVLGLVACHRWMSPYPVQHIQSGVHRKTSNSLCCLWNRFVGRLIPTVYASGTGNSGTTEETPTTKPTQDRLETEEENIVISDDDVKAFLAKETGRDRLRTMFAMHANGEPSADLAVVVNMMKNCGFGVFLLTSLFGGMAARDRFMERNRATKYDTKFLAARAYNDAIVFGALKIGLTWGIKSAIFAGLFMLTSQTIAVYRNKTSLLEYIIGGGVTCAVLRLDVGLRGMFAGGVIGSALGLVGGVGMCSLLHGSGQTQEKRHNAFIRELLYEKREIEMLAEKIEITAPRETETTPVTLPATSPDAVAS